MNLLVSVEVNRTRFHFVSLRSILRILGRIRCWSGEYVVDLTNVGAFESLCRWKYKLYILLSTLLISELPSRLK